MYGLCLFFEFWCFARVVCPWAGRRSCPMLCPMFCSLFCMVSVWFLSVFCMVFVCVVLFVFCCLVVAVAAVKGAEGQALLSTLAPLLLTPEDERVIKQMSIKGQNQHQKEDEKLGHQGGNGGHQVHVSHVAHNAGQPERCKRRLEPEKPILFYLNRCFPSLSCNCFISEYLFSK